MNPACPWLRPLAVALILLLSTGGLAGCSSLPFFGGDDEEEERESTESQVYRAAQSALRAGNYSEAISRLRLLEARFPFGRYAEQAQLEIIYAYYQSFQTELARSAADRFIRLHPNHPHVDYAWYLKGLAAYGRDIGLMDRVFPTDLASRDSASAREAFSDFNQLLSLYPDSPYAADARQRMVYLKNLLAAAEVNVARYYLKREAWVAAANRGRHVVEAYPRTPAVPDALAVMIEAYMRLELEPLAADALRVLATNFPTYPALDAEGNFVAYPSADNRDRSWVNMISLGFLDKPAPLPPVQLQWPEGTAPPPRPTTPPDADSDGDEGGWLSRLPFLG